MVDKLSEVTTVSLLSVIHIKQEGPAKARVSAR